MKTRHYERPHSGNDDQHDFGTEEARQRYLANLKVQRANLKDEELEPEKKPQDKEPKLF